MRALLLSLVALGMTAPAVDAQAYCALRDPNRLIFELFPEGHSYRSIVRTVDDAARAAVREELPFTLHFNELGRHTLYVVYGDEGAQGLVHVRSEAGKWGLVEVAWALDLDLRVTGYAFQRCRESGRETCESEAVKTALLGRGAGELAPMLTADGEALTPEAKLVFGEASDLGVVLLRNALKTIAVTEHAWGADVRGIKAASLASSGLRGAEDLVEVELYDSADHPLVASRFGASTGIDRDEAFAWDAYDAQGRFAGRVIHARWHQESWDIELWWTLDVDGLLVGLEARDGWPDDEVREAFEALVGALKYEEGCECSGPVELAATEVLFASSLTPAAKSKP